ncbi:hypothetical protein ABN028_19415 [Actinopolymorpha sp. B17G11]|uniref:hypothetical protein n=1 Tax=Actinopolymorpha sp. B17G11 TaxID=3160861 RepID=UPI0032E4069E
MREAQEKMPGVDVTTPDLTLAKPTVRLAYEQDEVEIDVWVTGEIGFEALMDRATRAMEAARVPGRVGE